MGSKVAPARAVHKHHIESPTHGLLRGGVGMALCPLLLTPLHEKALGKGPGVCQGLENGSEQLYMAHGMVLHHTTRTLEVATGEAEQMYIGRLLVLQLCTILPKNTKNPKNTKTKYRREKIQ